MTTPVWITGFEHGVMSGNGGGIFSAVSGVPVVTTAIKRSGSYALRVTPTGAGAINARRNLSASVQIAVIRAYIYIPSGGIPTATASVLGWQITTAAQTVGLTITSAGVARGSVGGGSAISGPTLNVDQWYKIDLRANITGTTWTLDWRIDDVAQTQATWSGQATTDSLQYLRMGSASTTVSLDVLLDDIVLSETSGDYPITAGSTELIKPTADGTHNAGTNVVENQAGSDIGAVNAWSLIDDIPMSTASEYIRQAANGSGNYAEVSFGNMVNSSSSIFGAMAVLAYSSETTSSNTGATIVSKDDFATQTNVHGSDSVPADMSDGSTSDVYYKSAIISGAVDTTTVNALKARVGFSTDATPDPYWINLAVEVAYVPSTSINVTVNQVTETDTAQIITRQKSRTVAQATGTNTAQTITPQSRYVVVQVSETDSAQAITFRSQQSVGLTSETDVAQPITRRKIKTVAQISETDAAQTITFRSQQAVNLISETDSAQVITARKIKTIGQCTETDNVQSIIRVKRLTVNQAIESDTAQQITNPGAGQQIISVAQIAETDAAQSITRVKVRVVSQVAETDLAQSLFKFKRVAIAQVVEIDLSQAIARTKQRALGQAFETDISQSVQWTPKKRLVNQVIEADLAQSITAIGGSGGSAHYIYIIAPESRVFFIPMETQEILADRTLSIPVESRTVSVSHD